LEALIQKVQKVFPLLIEIDANLATLQDFIRANAAAITTSVQGDSSRTFDLLHNYIQNNRDSFDWKPEPASAPKPLLDGTMLLLIDAPSWQMMMS
jgi:hypothetical protein